MTYPNVAKPVIVEMETNREMAVSIGTTQYGVDEITKWRGASAAPVRAVAIIQQ
jgi:hypothetical protein